MGGALEPAQVYALLVRDGQVALGPLLDHERAERDGVPQACVYVVLVDATGRVYVQHRSPAKRLFPDRKTVSASGHVDPGETFDQAAPRELREELGIARATLARIGAFSGLPHCGPVYEARSDEVPRPNPAELDPEKSGFLTRQEVRGLLAQADALTPSGARALRVWLERRDTEKA